MGNQIQNQSNQMEAAAAKERTYIMIKPDGVQRGLIGQIIARFETKGFKLVAMKLCMPGKAMFEQHYADLSSKPFFQGLVDYAAWFGKVTMLSRPEEKCSVPPNHSILNQELSEVTSVLMSEETLSMDLMLLNPPTRKLPFGSSQKNSLLGITTLTPGFMSEYII